MSLNKYLILKPTNNAEYKVILFDNYFWHENMGAGWHIHSGGFFKIVNGEIELQGGSVSLNLESRPEDKKFIKDFLGI